MKILRLNEVLEIVGVSRSTIYKMIDEGRFPKPLKITSKSIGWNEETVKGWIEGLSKESSSATN